MMAVAKRWTSLAHGEESSYVEARSAPICINWSVLPIYLVAALQQ